MSLREIRPGARILIDTNILIYALRRASKECIELVKRSDAGEVECTITTNIVAEFSHRQMIEEAKALGLTGSNPARVLGERSELIARLTSYADQVRDLLGSAVVVEAVTPDDFYLALEFQRQFGLLTMDSLNLAVARRLSIGEIATADRGFNSAKGFVVHHPADLVT